MIDHSSQIKHKFQPRENQKIAINEAVEGLTNIGFHALLMEMSLGKTKCSLNACEILAKYGALNRILILCPKSIMGVWTEEIPKHSHFMFEPLVWSGQKSKTAKFQRRVNDLMTSQFPILIVNIEAFQSKNKNLELLLKDYLQPGSIAILDESSKIKSMEANRTARIIEYCSSATYKINLTGTEIEESPLDVFSQFEFLHPGFWYKTPEWTITKAKRSFYLFRQKYAIMQKITMGEGRSFSKIVGYRKVEEIAQKIAPYCTRQKKKDWWHDMPDKLPQQIPVEMSPKQKTLYKEIKDNLLAEFGDQVITVDNAGSLLVRLRQIAGGFLPETGEMISDAGIKAIIDDVEEYSGKAIISCAFVAEIEGVAVALTKIYGADQVCTYYGATKDREGELKKFRDSAKFLVGNPSVMGYGLNLQFCSLMYHYSRSFSYATNAQLEDRIHRPGQTETCVYKDVFHVGTVQEKVAKSVKSKAEFVEAFQNMTIKDLLN